MAVSIGYGYTISGINQEEIKSGFFVRLLALLLPCKKI